ncbi:MAG: excinuclease ABC subunit UvrC [Oscillospiraceae bacterium]|nr:excinuclease ABC subunit UvrC [Oscillospiraceae bacterium]
MEDKDADKNLNLNPRLSYLREKTAKLTDSPGVYLMKNQKQEIIYIGKAKNLHKRVSSYFRMNAEHLPKVKKMVSHVWDYDFIVTGSEYEALLLECSFIKQHQPKYNILLKDDKGFYYIKVSDEAYPRITVEKHKTENGRYIATHTSAFVANTIVEEVNTIFQLPTCRKKFPQAFQKARPCLNYHIRKCAGICRGNLTKEDYQKRIAQAVEYIQKGSSFSLNRMQKEMQKAAENLDFEKAAMLRDRIHAMQKAGSAQKILNHHFKNVDVIASADNQDQISVSVLIYRNGRLQDKLNFKIQEYAGDSVLNSFVAQFYQNRRKLENDFPNIILLESSIADQKMTEKMLSEQTGFKIKIITPQKGSGLQLIQMAKNNAMESIAIQENRTSKELLAVEALGKILGMSRVPKYIEAYDISNFASESMVAGMVVFENGRPLKKAYKRFRIKEQQHQNDYACMQEVIKRRLSHLSDSESDPDYDSYFARKPDLILLDGGKGHVHAVAGIIQKLAPDIALFGMVKDKKHRTRAIAGNGNEISISGIQEAFQFVTRIQDEVHRYSVAYMHNVHKKNSFRSDLTQVAGIGQKRAQKLMLYFKTRDALWNADLQELQKAGISEKTAQALYAYLHPAQQEGSN